MWLQHIFFYYVGLCPNDKDNCGNTALHEAVLGGNTEICDLLLSHDADQSAINLSGFGVLHLAASTASLDMIEYWVSDRQIDVNSSNEKGITALHCAAHKGDHKGFDLLVSLGGDATARDRHGRTAYDYL